MEIFGKHLKKQGIFRQTSNYISVWSPAPTNVLQWYHNYIFSQRARGGKSSLELFKVSSKSNPNSVAGAIAGSVRESGAVELQAVGAGAINQGIKAIAIARGFLAPSGIDLICIPAFVEMEIDGEERTAMKLIVEAR